MEKVEEIELYETLKGFYLSVLDQTLHIKQNEYIELKNSKYSKKILNKLLKEYASDFGCTKKELLEQYTKQGLDNTFYKNVNEM